MSKNRPVTFTSRTLRQTLETSSVIDPGVLMPALFTSTSNLLVHHPEVLHALPWLLRFLIPVRGYLVSILLVPELLIPDIAHNAYYRHYSKLFPSCKGKSEDISLFYVQAHSSKGLILITRKTIAGNEGIAQA